MACNMGLSYSSTRITTRCPANLQARSMIPAKRKENERSDGSAPYSFSPCCQRFIKYIIQTFGCIIFLDIKVQMQYRIFDPVLFQFFPQPALQTVLSFLENRPLRWRRADSFRNGADDSRSNNFRSLPFDTSVLSYQYRNNRHYELFFENSEYRSDKILWLIFSSFINQCLSCKDIYF